MRTAVILPAYNEEITIRQVIEDFHAHLPEAAIFVIDNRSADATSRVAAETLARLGCKGGVLYEPRPGKAFAVQRAFADVEADRYLLVDADLTYPAAAARDLLAALEEGRADMVVGDRHALGHYLAENKRPFHNLGNTLVRLLVNVLFRASLNDILSGYRAFSRRFVKNYPVLSKGFAIEAEMTVHALDKGFTIRELPVEYRDRPAGSISKLRTYTDGFRVVRLIFEIFKNYRPLAFFSTFAALFFLAGLLAGAPVLLEYFTTGIVLHIPFAILSTGIMVFALITLSIGLVLDTVAANNRFNYQLRLIEWPSTPVDTETTLPAPAAGPPA
jgi:glycosyltransferase involved in cell wall biosynthesis